jgi:Outer membrane protein beta-barrel family/CarboxypepD_reg-like domain
LILKVINKFVFAISCVLLSASVFGQHFSITGKIYDQANQPIAYANIVLLKTQDSTFVTGTTSNDFGEFTTNEIASGNYILKVSFIGFEDFSQQVSLENNIEFTTIVLKESVESLSEVEIIYKKPTVKKEADRLVFNVENTALIEGTIFQVIKSTPGVFILDSGIIIKGSEPTVYINNRKVQLTSDELVQLLESSSANNIKSIEVITNPSAKYDAESGVVLNILMSKNLITGYRGSIFANYTQGVFPRYNIGTSQFFKNKKISFNLNYSYTNDKINRNGVNVINYLDSNDAIEEIWKSDINRNSWSETHNLNFNLDYFISDKNTLSLSSSTLYLPYLNERDSNNTGIANNNSDFLSRFNANSLSRSDKYNIGFDLDFVHRLKKGQLLLNTHYTTYNYETTQNVFSDFFDQNNAFESASEFNTNANQDTKIFTSKIDYSLPINETSNFETGVKYSNIKTNSDIAQFDVDINTGNEQINLQNTDAFNYDEKVFAAYSNYSLGTDKWSVSLGLRFEQTNIKGISSSNNIINTQDYLEWFPNASLQYNISDGFNVYTNYKRSIARPDYTYLNPFQFFLNEFAVVVGNPNLTPVFKDRFVIGSTLFKIFTIEAYYQKFDGNISEFPIQNNDTNIISYTPVNLDKTIDFGFDFEVYFNVTKDWSLYFGNSLYNIEEETNFGEGFIKQNQWANYSALQNNFTFLKDKSLNVNLTVYWAGKNLQGLAISEDRLVSYLSLSKTILKKKGVISLLVSDLFNAQEFRASNRYLNQFNTRTIDIDDRYIKLGFRYKFGNTILKTNEDTKEQEELDRLKNQSQSH